MSRKIFFEQIMTPSMRAISYFFVLALVMVSISCGQGERGTSTAGTSSGGSLATPTEAYKTAYDCRKRKDLECLKRVMSKELQSFLTSMGKLDQKTLDDMLRDLCEKPQAPTDESRNEKIAGDSATLEYPVPSGGWKTMDFKRVDGEWRMGPPFGQRPPQADANQE